jgi:hypothetical protein
MKEDISLPDYAVWFRKALDALEINANDVSKKTGDNNLKYYNILNGKVRPSFDTIQQVLNAYPRLNANWLMKGQKPILHESGVQIIGIPVKDLARLPMIDTTENYEQAQQHTVDLLNDERDLRDHVVIQLTDNSMAPRFTKGTKLLARPIPQQDWDYVNSKLCIVLYRTVFVMRRIKENELPSKNYLTLYADSPDAGFVIVKRDDLRSIWEVLEIIGGGIE